MTSLIDTVAKAITSGTPKTASRKAIKAVAEHLDLLGKHTAAAELRAILAEVVEDISER